ncbi:compound-resistance protein SugE [Seminavis robusta]|uniref:Compound-resistance protein SugE n=1 Tax=Seminavis robusta TaxID=568900 RepID=A0A9N8HQH7_9STRA|nr:compound-resistance protein SugE [Seminavis robusta]|eukprot:Sro1289_g259710.1 compound-resistance protein SugE (251) ;mRNA; r:15851-16695
MMLCRGDSLHQLLIVVLIGTMLQSAEAMASRMNPNNRLLPPQQQQHMTTLSPSQPRNPTFITSRQLAPQSAQHNEKVSSARKSPLFSANPAAAVTTAAATIPATSVAIPLKKRLLSIRGGAATAGFAVKGFIQSILDDVAASKTKSWIVLVCAILLETCASTLSKRARDTANVGLFGISVCLNLISLCGFCTCLAKLDVGVAYAVWAALGTVIVTTAGIFFFNEAMDPIKLVSLLLVIVGVVGLNLSDGH